jgi:CrcB protein
MIKDIILVGIGSGIGGIYRYLISLAMNHGVNGFPWGTFTVNVAGCLMIGILWGATSRIQSISPALLLFLMVGFCGGFTTFSTFMNENLLLGRDGAMLSAVLYTLLSLALGMIAVMIGYQIVKL